MQSAIAKRRRHGCHLRRRLRNDGALYTLDATFARRFWQNSSAASMHVSLRLRARALRAVELIKKLTFVFSKNCSCSSPPPPLLVPSAVVAARQRSQTTDERRRRAGGEKLQISGFEQGKNTRARSNIYDGRLRVFRGVYIHSNINNTAGTRRWCFLPSTCELILR